MTKQEDLIYDVIIIGGGASGTALLHTLARYTNLKRIALVEKYATLGSVNSNAHNNSQTLHVGDIETNYSLEKVKQVKPAAMMVAHYVRRLSLDEQATILRVTQKMILAVGEKEVAILEQRYQELKPLFPELQRLEAVGIASVEPAVMKGRDAKESVLALCNPQGYAVNFELLAQSFVKQTSDVKDKQVDVFLERPVLKIEQQPNGVYALNTAKGTLVARVVVVDTDSHSLGFAKAMGYGREFSLIPIAGTFYFSPKILRGKVYTMQEPRLPFAAVHGDPDMLSQDKTRWGPTARFFPVLESRNLKTMKDYFKASGLGQLKTWKSFATILLEPIRFFYLLKNILYDIPFLGTYFFAKYAQKIVPTLRVRDLRIARGFGGMRLQRVNTDTKELLLGEGKILGDRIIFNMSPSPGASVCLYNAMRDAEQIMKFFQDEFEFDKQRMMGELMPDEAVVLASDVSQVGSYSS